MSIPEIDNRIEFIGVLANQDALSALPGYEAIGTLNSSLFLFKIDDVNDLFTLPTIEEGL
jgi:hypothetical protein